MAQIPLEDSGGSQPLEKFSVFYGIRSFITVFKRPATSVSWDR